MTASASWRDATGNDFTARFPLAAAAIAALPAHSFLIDGEAIVTDDDGLAVFDLVRRGKTLGSVPSILTVMGHLL
jgi:ATP-dependent DNA ligase